jgi:hypothetical protein
MGTDVWNPGSTRDVDEVYLDGYNGYFYVLAKVIDTGTYYDHPALLRVDPLTLSQVWVHNDTGAYWQWGLAVNSAGVYTCGYNASGNRNVMLWSITDGAILCDEAYDDGTSDLVIKGLWMTDTQLYGYGLTQDYMAGPNDRPAIFTLRPDCLLNDFEYLPASFLLDEYFPSELSGLVQVGVDLAAISWQVWHMDEVASHESTWYYISLPGEGPSLGTPRWITTDQTITAYQLTLQWSPVAGASSYQVWVSGTQVAQVEGTSHIYTFPANDTYVVLLVAVSGETTSDASVPLHIEVAVPYVPPAPADDDDDDDPPADDDDDPTLPPLAVGGAVVGATVGVAGGVATDPTLLSKIKTKVGRKLGRGAQDIKALDAQGGPRALEGGATAGGAAAGGSVNWMELVKHLQAVWDRIPAEPRQMIEDAVSKYRKFSKQAALITLQGFQNVSNVYLESLRALRVGDQALGLSRLQSLSTTAQAQIAQGPQEFKLLTEEIKHTIDEAVAGAQRGRGV